MQFLGVVPVFLQPPSGFSYYRLRAGFGLCRPRLRSTGRRFNFFTYICFTLQAMFSSPILGRLSLLDKFLFPRGSRIRFGLIFSTLSGRPFFGLLDTF